MKKKNLKALSLKKASVSKLNGGSLGPTPIQLTKNIRDCIFTFNQTDCTTTWYSELNTACECPPSWQFACEQSVNIPCEA